MSPNPSDPPHPRIDDWLDDDGVEYEVEPPDERAAQAKRRLQTQAAAEVVERSAREHRWYEAEPWEAKLSWRFSLRDLFAVTAILAVFLTVLRYGGLCPATLVGGLGTFFWLLVYMERLDPSVQPEDRGERPLIPNRRSPLHISYSTADLLIAMTIAAVGFSLLRIFPAPLAAAALGFLVLAGIVLYWLGATPPRRAVLAWFILTAMYLVVSALAIVAG